MWKFKRFRDGIDRMSARDQNARGVALEALGRLVGIPPIVVHKRNSGWAIGMSESLASISKRWLCEVTEVYVNGVKLSDDAARNPTPVNPARLVYRVRPIVDDPTAPRIFNRTWLPRYGRVVRGSDFWVYHAALGDRCEIVVDPTVNRDPAWALHIWSEKINVTSCPPAALTAGRAGATIKQTEGPMFVTQGGVLNLPKSSDTDICDYTPAFYVGDADFVAFSGRSTNTSYSGAWGGNVYFEKSIDKKLWTRFQAVGGGDLYVKVDGITTLDVRASIGWVRAAGAHGDAVVEYTWAKKSGSDRSTDVVTDTAPTPVVEF